MYTYISERMWDYTVSLSMIVVDQHSFCPECVGEPEVCYGHCGHLLYRRAPSVIHDEAVTE